MASTNKTTNLDLPQWSLQDKPEMADFNDANAKVDVAVNTNKSDLVAHKEDKANPHGVTKVQVGLGSILNYALATKAEAEAGTSNVKYMTPLRTKQAIDTNRAIVESGSNAQGEYIKFDDGTMICRGKMTRPGVAASAETSGSWYYPIPFLASSEVVSNVTFQTNSGTVLNASKLYGGIGGGQNNLACPWGVKNLDTSARDITAHLTATGRWK